MSENKRYYWLKLDENFFEDDTIAWIEEQKNGKDYVIFYLKLCLKSLSNDGYLVRYVGQRLIPYDVDALAKITNTSPDTVAVAMKTFIEIGLVTRLESGEIYLNQINELIGSETQVAKRVRKHRAKLAIEDSNINLLHSNSEVTKCNTEKEIEKEIDIEIDKKILSSSDEQDRIPYKEIIEFLNQETKKNFRYSTNKTKNLIKARWNEGFTLNDFKQVVIIKSKQWLFDKNMSKYLRPETLFGNKFEGYLNEYYESGLSQLPDSDDDDQSIIDNKLAYEELMREENDEGN